MKSLRIAISTFWLVLASAAQAGRWADGINVPFILEHTPGRTVMNAPLFDLSYRLPNALPFCP